VGTGRGAVAASIPKFGLSDNFLLTGKFSTKNAKCEAEPLPHILVNSGTKNEILSNLSVGKLQLSAYPYFFNP